MGINNWKADNAEENSAENQNSKKSTGIENVKTIIADKLHHAAETLGEKATNPDAHYGRNLGTVMYRCISLIF